MGDKKIVSIVVPFYREEKSVDCFFQTLMPILLSKQECVYEIVCINDGSNDETLSKLIKNKTIYGENIKIVDLSRNFGKEAALTAGIDVAKGDAVIPIDCDLQDPIDVIFELIKKWTEGYDVVLAKRTDRQSDSFFKEYSASFFYKFFNKISDIKIPDNVGDFRLMSRYAVDALKQMPERRRFMKGLFAWIGFKTAVVNYVREERAYGKSKFSYMKLWNFALEGITSFSSVPLRLWVYFGGFIAGLSFCYASFIILRTIFHGTDVPGYASIVTIILFLGGIQLLGLGIIGEYIGRVYMEVKCRPIYIVRRVY